MELYRDKNQPVKTRIEDLLSRMTLEEKVAQLCGDLPMSFATDGMPDKELLWDTMQFEGILTSDGAGGLKTFTDFKTARTYAEADLGDEVRIGGVADEAKKNASFLYHGHVSMSMQ